MNVFTTYCPGYHGVYDIAKLTEGIYLDFTILSSCSIMSNELRFNGMHSLLQKIK